MYTIDQTQAMLEELSEQIPDVFFTKLNGGICLLEEEKLHDESKPGCPLYIMGEYHHNRQMGSYINIYYGSFIKVHGGLSESGFKSCLTPCAMNFSITSNVWPATARWKLMTKFA